MQNPRKRIIDELINLRAENSQLKTDILRCENRIDVLKDDNHSLKISSTLNKNRNIKLKKEIDAVNKQRSSDKYIYLHELNQLRSSINSYISENQQLRYALKSGDTEYLFREFVDLINNIPKDISNDLNSRYLFARPVECATYMNFDEIGTPLVNTIEVKRLGIIDLIKERI